MKQESGYPPYNIKVDDYNYDIEDNFLDQEEFDQLQTLLLNHQIEWYYNDSIDYETQKNRFQFCHTFYTTLVHRSPHFEIVLPIIVKINPISMWRIKANLLTKTSNIIENEFHRDISSVSEEKLKLWTTSIFYVNTNNGYTKFEDGTIVESVANRLVSFPAALKHTGSSCTDESTRVVINFNYFAP